MKKNKEKALQLVEAANKVEEIKKEEAFNESVASFVDNEFENLLKQHQSLEMGFVVYTIMFHLSQKFIFEKMPTGRFFRAFKIATQHASENYLDFINKEYGVKQRVEENNETTEKKRILN